MRWLFVILTFAVCHFWGHEALAEKRIAFVVGNNLYPNLAFHAQLQRAVNDSRAVAQTLSELGFEVIKVENVKRSLFNELWQKLLNTISVGDFVLFYYSGHGVEIEGQKFIVPSDIPRISYGRQEQIKREAISVSELLLDLRNHKPAVSVLILDACRDHPLIPQELRSATTPHGLAKIDAPVGTFVMYSAWAGQTALDRLPEPSIDPDPTNSVFTRKLLPLMRKPGLQLRDLAAEVRNEVHALAATVSHEQTPAYYDGVLGRFCFSGCDVPQRTALFASASPQISIGTSEMCDDGLTEAPGPKPCIKPGGGQSFRDCPECPEMLVVPHGSFLMGATQSELDKLSQQYGQNLNREAPRHSVTISKSFAVGKFAVRRDEFEAFIRESGYQIDEGCWTWKYKQDTPSYKSPGFKQTNSHPVVCVNWEDAAAYVSWLSKKTGKAYRLLTEAEREYVARAGTTTSFWWGESISPQQANYDGNYAFGNGERGTYRQTTVPVDSFKPNPWGLYQVHGNVWEWVEDCWLEDYTEVPQDGSPVKTEKCNYRVLRGGAWSSGPEDLRATYRHWSDPAFRVPRFGFRVARSITP
jgi:formylglycine-generating enzyme required for sulfatase activity